MTIAEKLETYNSKIKFLNESIISTEARLKMQKDQMEESKKKLLEVTKTNSVEEAIEYMKQVKELIAQNDEKLEKKIDEFLEKME